MNKDIAVIYFIVFTAGWILGWFFKRFNLFKIMVGVWIFAPILALLMQVNYLPFTAMFLAGAMFHWVKPYLKRYMN